MVMNFNWRKRRNVTVFLWKYSGNKIFLKYEKSRMVFGFEEKENVFNSLKKTTKEEN